MPKDQYRGVTINGNHAIKPGGILKSAGVNYSGRTSILPKTAFTSAVFFQDINLLFLSPQNQQLHQTILRQS